MEKIAVRTCCPYRGALAALILLLPLLGGACRRANDPLPLELSNAIIYDKNRDSNRHILPVLSESGGGFDAAEVDSPSVADDPKRASPISGLGTGFDRFLLFYEATDAAGVATIGLVTSGDEDFAVLGISPQQVIPLGAPGSGYDFAATDPCVVIDKRLSEQPNLRYKMWFEGLSGVNGSVSTIIYCTSADGVTWGGFTPCTGLDPDFGFVELRVADPAVAIENLAPPDTDLYHMWFEVLAADRHGEIGYAQSVDGVSWTILDGAGNAGPAAGPVFSRTATSGFDAFSVHAPSVVLDDTVSPGSLGRFLLWYEAGDKTPDVENTLGFARSADGRSWVRETLPILRPSSDNAVPLPFDSGDLEHPSALIDDSVSPSTVGYYMLWYTGDGEGGANPNRIGFAAGRAGP